jgi:hypothetical protein
MIIRLSDYMERPAVVQEERKRYSTFKITPIGGPKELEKWRLEQAAKLEQYNSKREQLKEKKVEFLAGGPDAPLGELTWKGKALLADSKAWDEKLKTAKANRRKLLEPEILTSPRAWTYEPEPKKPLKERFFNWLKNALFS